jgi:hypothetical protein
MALYLVSIGCSILALLFWAAACRAWLNKRSENYIRQDLADAYVPELPGLLSFILPRPIRRAYHFLLVSLIPGFFALFHFYQLTERRAHPDFWQGYLITLVLLALFLIVPAFFWERERLRRALP